VLRLAHHLEAESALWRFFFAGGPNYPRLDPKVDANLRQRLRPEIEELERLLDRDLTAWKLSRFFPEPRSPINSLGRIRDYQKNQWRGRQHPRHLGY
jgi:hypothetical protein